MSTSKDNRSNWGVAAALGAAVAASACCTIPLLLVSLGAGGAWIGTLTAFEPFRPFFIAVAVGALGYAAYREWRFSRRPDCECEVSMSTGLRRTLLVVGAIAALGLIASPQIISAVAGDTGGAVAVPADIREVVLEVDGMTCETCNITVQRALLNVDGVEAAAVTFEPPEAVVRYDAARVSTESLTEATTNVGYPSRLKTRS